MEIHPIKRRNLQMDFPLTHKLLYHIVLDVRLKKVLWPRILNGSRIHGLTQNIWITSVTYTRRTIGPVRDHKGGKAMRLRVAGGQGELWLEFPEHASVNVGQALQSVKDRNPEVYRRWCDRQGRLRRSLAVFVNGEHVRYRRGMETELSDGDEVYIIPMIAGG